MAMLGHNFVWFGGILSLFFVYFLLITFVDIHSIPSAFAFAELYSSFRHRCPLNKRADPRIESGPLKQSTALPFELRRILNLSYFASYLYYTPRHTLFELRRTVTELRCTLFLLCHTHVWATRRTVIELRGHPCLIYALWLSYAALSSELRRTRW